MRTFINTGLTMLCAVALSVALTARLSYAATRVERVRFEQQGDKVLIFYDLHGSEEAYTIALKLSSDGGRRFDRVPQTLSGDVGEHISPGAGKRIVWDALKDVEQLSGDRFVFAVTASWEGGGTEGMVWIPGGTFRMGSNDGDSDEKPVHTVTVDGFYMDATEVTNAQYCVFLNEQGNQTEGGVTWLDINDSDCLITKSGGQFVPKSGYEDHPVIEVTWYGARAYAEWRGGRLPTEAEWEYAARGGLKGKKYPWGDSISHDRANYSGTGGKDRWERTAPVGSFPPNGYGLYDMAGNVWEWCSDWYDENYYSRSPRSNPTGANTGTYRVLRGGSWAGNADSLRCALRSRNTPDDSDDSVGFRVARTP